MFFHFLRKNSEKFALFAQFEVHCNYRIFSAMLLFTQCVRLNFFSFLFPTDNMRRLLWEGPTFLSYDPKQAGAPLLLLSVFCILIYNDTSSDDPPGLWCYWEIKAAALERRGAWPVAMVSSSC